MIGLKYRLYGFKVYVAVIALLTHQPGVVDMCV